MRWVWPLLVLLLLAGLVAGAWLAFPQLVAWYLKDRATAEGIPLTLEGVAVSWDSRELTLDGVALGAANRPLRLRRVVLGFDADAPLWGLPLLERVHVTGGGTTARGGWTGAWAWPVAGSRCAAASGPWGRGGG